MKYVKFLNKTNIRHFVFFLNKKSYLSESLLEPNGTMS